MTILEAMASGTPVVAAQNGVYQEVGGNALLSFDADDTEALAKQLLRLEEKDVHARLREESITHAASFTWQRCASETLQAYQRAYLKHKEK